MSVLPSGADIVRSRRHVRLVPQPDSCAAAECRHSITSWALESYSGKPTFRRPSIKSLEFVCPPRAINLEIVNAGSNSSIRAAASRASASRPRWAKADARQQYAGAKDEFWRWAFFYDEKPGIQAIATTAPDLPPEPGVYPTFTREFEYKRHGTVSLLAGIDLVTGKVHALVTDRHRSREFIDFLKLVDAAYPPHTAIRLILDNHSAHISKETNAWLATRPAGRFEFTFTPKHGSWLNLIEGFFSKLARSVLRHIRVASKQELKERIKAAMDHFNEKPVVHTWSYKLKKAA
jgi:transposase